MSRQRLGLICCVAAALVAALVIGRHLSAWAPLELRIRDDAFYYFVWVRSLLAGEGPVVSLGEPTSGIHLGWGLLLSLTAAFSGIEALPMAACLLGLGLHLGVGFGIARASGLPASLGYAVAFVYTGSAFLVREAMNGQETALACLGLLGLCLGYRRGPLSYGLLTALALMCRSDLVFLAAALAWGRRADRHWRMLALVLALCAYAGWNFLLAGGALQDSARPIPWLMAEEAKAQGLSYGAWIAPQLPGLIRLVPLRLGSSVLALCWLLVAVLAWRAGKRDFACLLAGGLGLVLFHCLLRVYPRDYYFAPLALPGALALCWLLKHRQGLGLVLLVLAICGNAWRLQQALPAHGAQREMWMAGQALARVGLGEARVGSFNSGILTWLHPGRTVNLDGVVNRPAFQATRARRLATYLDEMEVGLLCDNPVQFAAAGWHSVGRYFRVGEDAPELEELLRCVWVADPGRAGRREGAGSFRLYRRPGCGLQPEVEGELLDWGPAPGGQRLIYWRARAGDLLSGPRGTGFVADRSQDYLLQVPLADGGGGRFLVANRPGPVLDLAPDR